MLNESCDKPTTYIQIASSRLSHKKYLVLWEIRQVIFARAQTSLESLEDVVSDAAQKWSCCQVAFCPQISQMVNVQSCPASSQVNVGCLLNLNYLFIYC